MTLSQVQKTSNYGDQVGHFESPVIYLCPSKQPSHSLAHLSLSCCLVFKLVQRDVTSKSGCSHNFQKHRSKPWSAAGLMGFCFWGLQLLPFEVCKLLVVVVVVVVVAVVVVVVVFMGFLFVYLTYCHVYDLFVAMSGRVFVKARVQ